MLAKNLSFPKLLRLRDGPCDTGTHCHLFQPLQPSKAAWPLVPRDPMTLPRLRGTDVTLGGSTCSKVEHVSQRHTETHRTLAQGVTELLQQPRRCHQEDLHQASTDRSPPPQGQAEAGITSTVTQTRPPGSQTCMQLPWVQHSSSVPAQTQPSDSPHSFLFACWSSLMLTHTHGTHTHPTGPPGHTSTAPLPARYARGLFLLVISVFVLPDLCLSV